jgi:hypothetical protein
VNPSELIQLTACPSGEQDLEVGGVEFSVSDPQAVAATPPLRQQALCQPHVSSWPVAATLCI